MTDFAVAVHEAQADEGGTAVLLATAPPDAAPPVRVPLRALRSGRDRDGGRLRVTSARAGAAGGASGAGAGTARFEADFSDGQRRLYEVTWTRAGAAAGAGLEVRALGPRGAGGGGGDLLVRDIGQLVTCDPARAAGHPGTPGGAAAGAGALGVVQDAAVVIAGGRVVWAGRAADIPEGVIPGGAEELDAGGACVLPGFVDAHNHLVFAGDRAAEYAARLAGASYADVLKAGGGILHTVRATRAASTDALAELARERLDRLLSFGVTTAEAKSGYGLERAAEWRLLEVIRALGETHPVELVPTFLGAHAVPAEHRGSATAREAWVDELCRAQVPAVAAAGLARFCDVFVDDGAYTLEEGARILRAARDAGLALKIHAEEIAHTGAAAMAAALGAVSADHLERIDAAGIAAMAAAGTVAVLLPGTATVLGLPPPPVRALADAGVALALGTDLNPGTCNSENLGLMVGLACAHFRLSVEEAVLAVTRNAARALGVADRCGVLAPGLRGDLVVLDAPDYQHLAYRLGVPLAAVVVKEGEVVFRAR
ncbi:MAG TPA: imidazolonepropionase [Myxococcota bacterium]|nr:imidazolonepropionase [Myxococcota bacterium]